MAPARPRHVIDVASEETAPATPRQMAGETWPDHPEMAVPPCHPPVGLNLYVASGIAKMGITELTIAVWPWLLTMLGFLVLVTYIPEISLWLPKMLGMM